MILQSFYHFLAKNIVACSQCKGKWFSFMFVSHNSFLSSQSLSNSASHNMNSWQVLFDGSIHMHAAYYAACTLFSEDSFMDCLEDDISKLLDIIHLHMVDIFSFFRHML